MWTVGQFFVFLPGEICLKHSGYRLFRKTGGGQPDMDLELGDASSSEQARGGSHWIVSKLPEVVIWAWVNSDEFHCCLIFHCFGGWASTTTSYISLWHCGYLGTCFKAARAFWAAHALSSSLETNVICRTWFAGSPFWLAYPSPFLGPFSGRTAARRLCTKQTEAFCWELTTTMGSISILW